MALLKFRIYWEEDDGVYRDIVVRANQSFLQLHEAILQAFGFDQKHQAVFYRSNENWQRGREIILRKDDQNRKTPPLLMAETTISDGVRNPNQKFIYVYDFIRHWTFLIELISISRNEDMAMNYPVCVRKEGTAPGQYGNKKPVKDKMVETEEHYDLDEEHDAGGFGEEGEPDVPDVGETDDL